MSTENGHRENARRAAAIFMVGALLSATASIVANSFDGDAAQERFVVRTEEMVHRLERDTTGPLEVVYGLAGLFEASNRVTRSEFLSFAEPALARHPNVSTLLWVPRVKRDDVARFVATQREHEPSYALYQGLGPERVRVEPRDVYHPIAFMSPIRPETLGNDLAATDTQRQWIEQAHEGGVFVTPRVMLPGSVAAVGAMVPVRKDGREHGIVVAVFRMEKLVRTVFTNDELSRVDLMLRDADGELIYSTTGSAIEPRMRRGRHEQTMRIAKTNWQVVLQGKERLGTRLPAIVTIIGVVISAIVALLHFLLRRIRLLGEGARRLGQYELHQKLGEGGMGTVYRAEHRLLRRSTAVKVIRAEVAARGTMRERFEREVHAASQLSHPNSIVVYDYGVTPGGELYYAMELVDGIDLHRLVERFGPLRSARVAHVLVLTCGALAEAHARGIVHRDVKPANIMLSRCGGMFDFPKVLDFGLALTRRSDEAPLTIDGAVGTPHFMAPEQSIGAVDLGAAVDVYALGCVAYFLLTGENLFEAPNVAELVGKHLTSTPIPLSAMASKPIDPALEALVMRCLSKVPDDRPTVAEIADSLVNLAREWTQADAAAWWDTHMDAPISASVPRPSRVLTVRLDERLSVASLGSTWPSGDSFDASHANTAPIPMEREARDREPSDGETLDRAVRDGREPPTSKIVTAPGRKSRRRSR